MQVKVKRKKKTNNNFKLALILGVLAVILLAVGVGGYFLSNESSFGGGFNAMMFESDTKSGGGTATNNSQTTNSNKVKVTGIKFDLNTIKIGEEKTLNVTIGPNNATDKKFTCASSNTKIATVRVTSNGCVVKGVKAGTAKITVTSSDGKKSASEIINVQNTATTTTTGVSISFGSTSYNVDVGSTKKLPVTITPAASANKGYTCTSSNTQIATITSDCTVKGVKVGMVTITAKAKDGGKTTTTVLNVTTKSNGTLIKVASFNVGGFTCGSSKNTNCTPSEKSIASLIKNNSINIVGIQEAGSLTKMNNLKKETGYNGFYQFPYNPANKKVALHSVLTSYPIKSNETKNGLSNLYGDYEIRYVDKVVITVNKVNISLYNTHLGLKDENEKHFKSLVEIVKNDPNPIIMTADWNYSAKDRFTKYFSDFEIAAYDTSKNNMWGKASYVDAVLVKSKGHINIVSSEVIKAYKTYSDHNMVAATLEIK